jgi:hypothetical protein
MKNPINTTQREGFLNRHIVPLPSHKCILKIITMDLDVEQIDTVEWRPFNEANYSKENLLAEGYLGTAKLISGRHAGIGFHAWENHSGEFIYYQIV